MSNCKICGRAKNVFMQNKFVCLSCDELLFDMEIEVDGHSVAKRATQVLPVEAKKAKLLRLVDKKVEPTKEQEKPEVETEAVEEKDATKTKKAA